MRTLVLAFLVCSVVVAVTARPGGTQNAEKRLARLVNALKRTADELEECRAQLPITTTEGPDDDGAEEEVKRQTPDDIRVQIMILRGELRAMRDELEACRERLGSNETMEEEEEEED